MPLRAACRAPPDAAPPAAAPPAAATVVLLTCASPPTIRFALLAGAVALFVIAVPASVHAQSSDTDPALEALIPDSALSDPKSWVRDTEAARSGSPEEAVAEIGAPDREVPAADLLVPRLAWPDPDTPLPAITVLAPDPELQAALDVEKSPPAVGLALPDTAIVRSGRLVELVESQLGRRITLAYPADFAAFPQMDTFRERFAALSDIRNLADGNDDIAQLARRARADRILLLRLLERYGFYDAEVAQTITAAGGTAAGGTAAGGAQPRTAITPDQARFRFAIRPGARYRLGRVDLGGLAEAGDHYPALRPAFAVASGDPLDIETIASERVDLVVALAEGGYPFAEVGAPELLIDHARAEGDLTVPVRPGGRYVFGRVASSRPRFLGDKHLADIARFDPGDPYRASDVEDLRRAIIATGLVSSVAVTPREAVPPANGAPGEVMVDVAIAAAPLRTIAGSLGYGTEEGPRAEVSWEHRNLFPPEGMLRLRAIVATQEQLLGATFRRNNFRARDQVLSVDLFANTIDRDAYQARTLSAVAKYERLSTLIFQKRFAWSAGLELVATQEREGALDGSTGPRETYFVAAVPGHVALDESDDLIDPTRGFRAMLRFSPENSWQGGDSSFYVRAQLDGSYYQPFGERVVLAARARLGSIFNAPLSAVAPSRRLYAGGGGSVRGYGYQRIGPEDTLGEPTGGRSLTEFSLEARVRTGLFGGALSLVPFIDAGAVDESNTPRFRELQFGAGIGVRYHTSFGPLRIDVATPLNPRPEDSPIAVYVALGQAF